MAGGHHNAAGSIVETTLPAPWPLHVRLIRVGSNAVLSWSGGQGPYQVQQSTDLSQPDAWQDVGGPITGHAVSVPIESGTVFLRVRGQ